MCIWRQPSFSLRVFDLSFWNTIFQGRKMWRLLFKKKKNFPWSIFFTINIKMNPAFPIIFRISHLTSIVWFLAGRTKGRVKYDIYCICKERPSSFLLQKILGTHFRENPKLCYQRYGCPLQTSSPLSIQTLKMKSFLGAFWCDGNRRQLCSSCVNQQRARSRTQPT